MSTSVEPEPSPEPGAAEGPVSRRALIGGGLLTLGVVGGGVAGFAVTRPPRAVVPDAVPPADVLAAIAREQTLLAAYDAALTAGANPLWTHVRAEHQAHVEALTALLPAGKSSSPSASPSASPSTSATSGTVPGAAQLVAAERAAADAARAACLAGNGTAAVLLACIAASEASHAAVLG